MVLFAQPRPVEIEFVPVQQSVVQIFVHERQPVPIRILVGDRMAQIPLRKELRPLERHVVNPELQVLFNLEGQRDGTVLVRHDDRRDPVVGIAFVVIELPEVLRAFAQRLVVQETAFDDRDLLAELGGGIFHVPLELNQLHSRLQPEFEGDPHLVAGQVFDFGDHVGEIPGVVQPLDIRVERFALELRAGTQLDVEGDLLIRERLEPLLVEFDFGHLGRPGSGPRKHEGRQRPADNCCEFHDTFHS